MYYTYLYDTKTKTIITTFESNEMLHKLVLSGSYLAMYQDSFQDFKEADVLIISNKNIENNPLKHRLLQLNINNRYMLEEANNAVICYNQFNDYEKKCEKLRIKIFNQNTIEQLRKLTSTNNKLNNCSATNNQLVSHYWYNV